MPRRRTRPSVNYFDEDDDKDQEYYNSNDNSKDNEEEDQEEEEDDDDDDEPSISSDDSTEDDDNYDDGHKYPQERSSSRRRRENASMSSELSSTATLHKNMRHNKTTTFIHEHPGTDPRRKRRGRLSKRLRNGSPSPENESGDITQYDDLPGGYSRFAAKVPRAASPVVNGKESNSPASPTQDHTNNNDQSSLVVSFSLPRNALQSISEENDEGHKSASPQPNGKRKHSDSEAEFILESSQEEEEDHDDGSAYSSSSDKKKSVKKSTEDFIVHDQDSASSDDEDEDDDDDGFPGASSRRRLNKRRRQNLQHAVAAAQRKKQMMRKLSRSRYHRPRTRNMPESASSSSAAASNDEQQVSNTALDSEQVNLSMELAELRADMSDAPPLRKNLRARKQVNYQILPPPPLDGDVVNNNNNNNGYGSGAPTTPSRRRNGAINNRRLFNTAGPFGGAGLSTVFGGSSTTKAMAMDPFNKLTAGPVADDSSDDDDKANTSNSRLTSGGGGQIGPLGRIKSGTKSKLADADPLGVDMNVDFSSIGGLDDHINQLKEMVALPLLYPELFERFHIIPPRGVLFHGPPGTGKTLVARALAASCSTGGRKVAFYMRKGADALSKWVGEAERQLRLLFEEARNTQPSIIFFDEIDGLAPVRSSKQEQIHASIVSTLLALMDGMDNRGQVIVIGATNRPDSVDPALRRPGRFDREFYFPLPNLEARKKIIEINTRKWEPPLDSEFMDKVARLTKGYGGADLRALCTESALNAIQRRYPQIYQSQDKLLVDPSTIRVSARDVMLALERIIPSSARSAASGAAPLPDRIVPLLGSQLQNILDRLDLLIPRQKKVSMTDEAQYAELFASQPDGGFKQEKVLRDFSTARVFRPRFLICGNPGMGQEYIASAVLHHLEGFHIQSFDLATLMSDSTRTPEAAAVQLFIEVKRHRPSVIYIPNIDTWMQIVSETLKTTFFGLVKSLSPSDPVLVLGMADVGPDQLDDSVRETFGYAATSLSTINSPNKQERLKYFESLEEFAMKRPSEFPDLVDARPKKPLPKLPLAPPPPPKILSKQELRGLEKKDKQLKNVLKIRLSPLMELLKVRYKRFRKPIIDESCLSHLFEEDKQYGQENGVGRETQQQQQQQFLHEYERTDDGNKILEVSTGRAFYNMDLDIIEERLWNGYYSLPKQMLQDIEMIVSDSNVSQDRDRVLKASEMIANAQVFIDEMSEPDQLIEFRHLYDREQARKVKYEEALRQRQEKIVEELPPVETTPTPAAAHSILPEMTLTNELIEGGEDDDADETVAKSADVVQKEIYGIDNLPVDDDDQEKDDVPSANGDLEHNTSSPEEKAVSSTSSSPSPPPPAAAAPEPGPEPEPVEPPIKLDPTQLHECIEWISGDTTKGLTIEELEQVYATAADTMYEMRSSYDRTSLTGILKERITKLRQDMGIPL